MSLLFGICQQGSGLPLGFRAKYPFDGNANDISGNGYNGSVSGATFTTGRKGIVNTAYLYNGSSYITIPAAVCNGLSAVSVSLWINPTSLGGSDGIIYHRGTFVFGLCLNEAGTGLKAYVNNGSSNAVAATANGILASDTWYHVVMTWTSGGYVKIYLNNVDVTSTPSAVITGNISLDDTIKFGYDDYSTDRYFYGKIDDAVIYGRVLSLAEISALFYE
jgi:hypothetical protein